ncbi:MAG: energy transducer TonB [Bacteroidota bacterium]
MRRIIYLLFICSSTAISYAQNVTFTESDWKTDSTYCESCAICFDGQKSKIEKQTKEFVFYCNGLSVGSWYLTKDYLPKCDSVFYHTSNSLNTNIGGSDFFMVDLALFDIYKEVKESCPLEGMYSALPADDRHTEYSAHINQFFPFGEMEILGEEGEIFEEEDLDRMPTLRNCINLNTQEKKEACTKETLRIHLRENFQYPIIARENGITGKVFIRFVIEVDGTMTEFEILRNLGGGCGQYCYDTTYKLYEKGLSWEAGEIEGKKVRSYRIVDFTFSLK